MMQAIRLFGFFAALFSGTSSPGPFSSRRRGRGMRCLKRLKACMNSITIDKLMNNASIESIPKQLTGWERNTLRD